MSEPNSMSPREHLSGVISSLWWLSLLRGALLILVGGYALLHPGMSITLLTQVLGIYVIAEGILAIVAAMLGETPSRGWTAVRGILAILVGVFVFGHSAVVAGIAARTVLYVIGGAAILAGVLDTLAAIQDRKQMEGEGWVILGGVLTIVFGVILLMAPINFGLLVVRLIGAYAILYGVSLIFLAFHIRGVGKALRP